jgi:6-phosphogluconolactonase
MVDEVITMAREVIVSETPEALADRAAADFVDAVEQTLRERDRFTVALPGGATPKLFFTRLTQEPYRSKIPWDKLWLFWGDERCVPPEHPESNFGMAREFLLNKVSIPSAHVQRIRGEDAPPESARAYAKVLHDFFRASPEWPTFDLIILGMGTDGHTASLMPGTAALHEERRWVVENVVRSLQTIRITMTLPVIDQARRVWFLVTGAKKAAAYAKAISGPREDCPASLVQPESGVLRWYIDKAVSAS